MTVLTKRAVEVFAPTTAGGQLRGADMAESMVWGTELERSIEGAAVGRIDQATWAGLAAIAGTRAGQPAIVYGPDAGTHTDPVTGAVVPNIGEYYWSASPAGWRRVGNLQRTLVHALNTGAGTPNAVQATSDVQFSQAAYSALITVNFVASNTGPMTLSINGEAPRPLVTNTGEAITPGYIVNKMSALVQIDSDGNYRLFSYGDATAILAAAEAAATRAEIAAENAEAIAGIEGIATEAEAIVQDESSASNTKIMTVLRTLQAINESIIQKGHTVPDLFTGLANDRQRIQAALDADEGTSVFFNRAFTLTPGSDPQVLLWSRPKRVFGSGMFQNGSQLQFASTIPSDMDWIRLRPNMALGGGETRYGWSWEKTFLRREPGSTPGRRGCFIDLETDQASSFLAKFNFTDNWLWEPGAEAFYSNKDGDTGSGVFNGFFGSYIARNWLVSGSAASAVMHLRNSGDSLTVEDNILQGYGVGIRTSPVVGAATQVFQKNNITARGGAIDISGGQQVKFLYNQCELVVPMASGAPPSLDAMVLINAESCEIIGNNLGAKNYGHCVRITSGARNVIAGNVMHTDTAGGKYHVVFTGVDVGLYNEVRADNRFLNLTGSPARAIFDGGTTNAQIGAWKKLTLSNGWVDHSDANFAQGLFFMVDENKRICLRGSVTGGTNTPGTTIATLPPGARPVGFAQRFSVMLNSGAMGTLLVTAGGAIQIEAALSSVLRVSFDDVVINSF